MILRKKRGHASIRRDILQVKGASRWCWTFGSHSDSSQVGNQTRRMYLRYGDASMLNAGWPIQGSSTRTQRPFRLVVCPDISPCPKDFPDSCFPPATCVQSRSHCPHGSWLCKLLICHVPSRPTLPTAAFGAYQSTGEGSHSGRHNPKLAGYLGDEPTPTTGRVCECV